MGRDLFHLMSRSLQMLLLVAMTFLGGCVAQQADMKQTERAIQQKLKQQDDQLSQTRARQSQEISMLREQDLPQLRGEMEKVRHQAEELNARQQDLKDRDTKTNDRVSKLSEGLDSVDVVLGAILFRIEELEKRLHVIEKH